MFNNSFLFFHRGKNFNLNALVLPSTLAVLLLLTTISAIFTYQKVEILYVTMSLRNSTQGSADLYYDLGRGFREEDKAVIQIMKDPSAVVYAFAVPNRDLLRFRFDPPDTYKGEISIGNIRIVNARGKILREIDLNQMKPLHQIKTFQHTGSEIVITFQNGADDPQIGIDLDSPFRPTWLFLKDGFFLALIACEILLIILIYFMILYVWPRWRIHSKRSAILVTFLFLYIGGLWVLSGKATTIYLKITMQSSSYGTAQLFFDTGNGYSETSSAHNNITGRKDFSDYLFRLPNNDISQFRFDPLSSAGRFILHKIEVINGLGVLIHSLTLSQVQPESQIREYKFLDQDLHLVTDDQADDPQLIVNLQRSLHIKTIDLLLNPVFFVCALLLFPISLLSTIGITWGWRKGNVEAFYYLPSTRHKYIMFTVCIIISLVILSGIHRQSYSDALRYTRVAEGNIADVVYHMWTVGVSSLAVTLQDDAQTWGRIRPAHWLFYNIPFALTLARNGDLFRHDAMVPISKRINGDLQTHTLFLILCMAVASGGLAWLIWHLTRSWLAFLLFPLYVSLSYTICENLLVGYADSQEIPQLLWISLYLVSISKLFSGQKPSIVCEVFATLFLLLAYATKETSLVMLPIFSGIFGLFIIYNPFKQKGVRPFFLRQIGWQFIFSGVLVAFVWSFRSGAYAVPNYMLKWQNLLSSFQSSLKTFNLGVSWMNILLLMTIPLFVLLIRRIIRKQFIIGRHDGIFLLLIIAVSLCYGFWMIYMPWKEQVAKYYLPAIFWGCFAVVILQICLADQFLKRGYRAVCTIWLIVSCGYVLRDLPHLNTRIQNFYMHEYGYRQSVPIISKDIVASLKTLNRHTYRVHIIGSPLFQEGALPFQRQVNLLYGMNIAVKEQQVRRVKANERNYFRSYLGQPSVDITLSQSLSDQYEKDVIYVCQVPGEKEWSSIHLDGFHVSHQWEDKNQGIRIVKYDRI
jgi:hypothetical protein